MGPEGGSRGHRIYIFILQFLQEYIPDGTKEMIELQGLACVINAKSYSCYKNVECYSSTAGNLNEALRVHSPKNGTIMEFQFFFQHVTIVIRSVIPIGIEKSHRKFMQIHYLR